MSQAAGAGRHHVVATAGHVDHGKSTLLRALTGMEPDRWEEERRRGLTIDLGFVWTDLPSPGGGVVTVAFVDVPGHERFVANMLAGAGAVRLALLVVAADDGWSAQTQEHADILDLLGVGAAIVVVTKAAVAGDDRSLEVAADVERRLSGTSLGGAPIVVTDAVVGAGLDELRRVLAGRLAATPDPPDDGRARLWVDRSFTIAGAGTVVTGTLAGGAVASGDTAAVLPSVTPVRVRGLQALGRSVPAASPGSRVAVNLAGVARAEVGRGAALVAGGADPASRWTVTGCVDTWLTALPGQAVDGTGAWQLHAGSAAVAVSVHPLLAATVTADSPGYVRLRLAAPLPLQAGDRFVLRDAGRRATVGGGIVLDPAPPGRVRGPDQRLERVDRLATVHAAVADGGAVLSALVAAWGGAGPAAAALAAAGHTGAVPSDLVATDSWLLTRDALARWTGAMTAAVTAHADDPARPGATRAVLAAAAETAGCPAPAGAEVTDLLVATGVLTRRGAAYALPQQAAAADAARADRRGRLLGLLSADPFQPPELDAAAGDAGVDHTELQQLVQAGEVVRCGPIGFTRAAVTEAVTVLRRLEAGSGPFTASQARQAWGTTRKYAIPLLEHLDAAGVTRLDGTTRTVVSRPVR